MPADQERQYEALREQADLHARATTAYRMLGAFIARGEYEADVRELLDPPREISHELGALLWRRYYQIRAEHYGGQITVNDDTFRMLLDAAGIPDPEDDVVTTTTNGKVTTWHGRTLTIR